MLSGKAIFADEDVYAGYKKRRHADELVDEALVPLGVPRELIERAARARSRSIRRSGCRSVDELATELEHVLEPSTEDVASCPPPPQRNETRASRRRRIRSGW